MKDAQIVAWSGGTLLTLAVVLAMATGSNASAKDEHPAKTGADTAATAGR